MDAHSSVYVHNESFVYPGTETSDKPFTRQGINSKGKETTECMSNCPLAGVMP